MVFTIATMVSEKISIRADSALADKVVGRSWTKQGSSNLTSLAGVDGPAKRGGKGG